VYVYIHVYANPGDYRHDLFTSQASQKKKKIIKKNRDKILFFFFTVIPTSQVFYHRDFRTPPAALASAPLAGSRPATAHVSARRPRGHPTPPPLLSVACHAADSRARGCRAPRTRFRARDRAQAGQSRARAGAPAQAGRPIQGGQRGSGRGQGAGARKRRKARKTGIKKHSREKESAC